MRFLRLVAVLLACAPTATHAAWVVGVRSGYALRFGDVDAGRPMSDLVTGQIPLQLEAGYRFKALTLSGFASYGFGSVSGATKDLCDAAGQSCSSSSLRIGGQLLYAFGRPVDQVEPWIGAGIGYEDIRVKRYTTTTWSGSEWLILEGGVDWRFGTAWSMGAFASASLGTYTNVDGGGGAGVIQERQLHEWVTLGLRGTFSFGG